MASAPKSYQDGKLEVFRSKTIRISCTEDQAKEIVLPLVNFTAYMLSVDTALEMPSFKTMLAATSKAKTNLAKLMAAHLQRVVLPANLAGLHVEHISVGSYFRLSVSETVTVKKVMQRRNYSVVLFGEVKMPLIMKLTNMYQRLNPGMSTEDLAKFVVKETGIL